MGRYFFAAAATALLGAFCASPARAGLISHWSFEGNTLDPVGGRNGTLLGDATYSSNVPGALNGISTRSLVLDGSLDKMVYDVVGSDTVSGTFSIAMWVNPTVRRPLGTLSFFGTRAPLDDSFDLKFRTDSDIRLDLGNGASFPVIRDSPPITIDLNTWYHVAAVVTPTSYTVYLNGSALMTGSFGPGTPLLWDANHDIAIGAINASPFANGPPLGEDFQGMIDDVRVYDNALTASEVAALASPQATVVPEPTTLALFGMGSLGVFGWMRRRRRWADIPRNCVP